MINTNKNNLPLVSIISVNYNQSEVSCEMIESLRKASYPNLDIIIVENGSPNDNPEIIKEKYPEINLIISKENLGFAGGNNLGVKEAKGKYVLFLNNDTEVESGFLEPLVEQFESNPEIGMMSPKLIYYHSENQKLIQYAGANSINPFTGRGSKIGFKAIDEGQFNDIRETKFGHGAALMLPMKVIKKVGLMPDIYFLYYEEHDWCEMVKRNNYKIYYVGKSKVLHKESISVGKNSILKSYYMTRSRLIFMKRNHTFIQLISALLFFTFISLPKNIIQLFLKGEFKLLKAFLQAYFWHFKNHNVKKNPKLIEGKNGDYKIIDESNQRIKQF
ncbi:MAG: glycosyltransferase family 2 protein [Bacteroidota bacterium]|nr:glycosyltransferase family 2 protein [Bacteroidota bacterium]